MTDPALPEILLFVGTLRHCDSKSGASLRRSLPRDIISVLEQDFCFGNLNEIYKASVESVICGGCNWVGWRGRPRERTCYSARVGELLICPSRCVRPHGFCLGICVSLSISPWWYGADKKRFLPQHEQLFGSSHDCVFCLAGSP